MLTEKQVKEELPKGFHKNIDLARRFPNHGKPKERVLTMPVDKRVNVIQNVMDTKNIHAFVPMLLNRQNYKRFNKK